MPTLIAVGLYFAFATLAPEILKMDVFKNTILVISK
jgi:hypothetical protein